MMKNERKEKIKLIIYFMLTLTVMIIIFRFSSQNAYESMKVSRSFLNETLVLFDRILPSGIACFLENYIRKIAHFTVYTCLGIFTSLTIKQLDCVYPNKIKIWILKSLPWLITLCYAVSDELHQLFVPGRSCELRDVCIDMTGAALGILLIWLINRIGKVSPKEK